MFYFNFFSFFFLSAATKASSMCVGVGGKNQRVIGAQGCGAGGVGVLRCNADKERLAAARPGVDSGLARASQGAHETDAAWTRAG